MAEMKNICGKIPVELHEKVRAEIEERETSTQIFIRQVIEEHFNRLENKGEESMEKRTLAVQVTEKRACGASDRPYPYHRNPAGNASFCGSISAASCHRTLQVSEYQTIGHP